MDQAIFERVRKVTADNLDASLEDIKAESSFTDDLGADSLDVVELVMALEEEFNIEIPDEVAEQIDTVGKAAEHIQEKS